MYMYINCPRSDKINIKKIGNNLRRQHKTRRKKKNTCLDIEAIVLKNIIWGG